GEIVRQRQAVIETEAGAMLRRVLTPLTGVVAERIAVDHVPVGHLAVVAIAVTEIEELKIQISVSVAHRQLVGGSPASVEFEPHYPRVVRITDIEAESTIELADLHVAVARVIERCIQLQRAAEITT